MRDVKCRLAGSRVSVLRDRVSLGCTGLGGGGLGPGARGGLSHWSKGVPPRGCAHRPLTLQSEGPCPCIPV